MEQFDNLDFCIEYQDKDHKERGTKFISAWHENEAIELFRAKFPDLVFLDIQPV